MTAWGCLRLPWKCCQPPTPQAIFTHLHNESNRLCPPVELMASLRGLFGDSLPTGDLAELLRNRAADGTLSDTRHRKLTDRKNRDIAWLLVSNTANLSTPKARLQSKATLNSPPLLLGLLWQPGIWKPKQTWKRILSLAPKVYISKLFAEGSCCPLWYLPDGGLAKSGTWKPPSRKVISIWNNWNFVRWDVGVIGRTAWQEKLEIITIRPIENLIIFCIQLVDSGLLNTST